MWGALGRSEIASSMGRLLSILQHADLTVMPKNGTLAPFLSYQVR